ncbi:hypothetical protein F511_04347 [Dorcoceras hygrometricum]|uniref:HSP20-like chaperones superfamily protein n=1 Tax=Dorcoceras hygrometricum TaxID=472368 RepID=A0A2Z7BK93_9LAMI|nr:hypothetical protein F511_04347 [Dorcoceras hygrometricum]
MPSEKRLVCEIGDALLTALSMENHHPSTLLSMDSSASSSHDELDLEMNRQVALTLPPDINLPFSAEISPEHCDILDVGLGTQVYETDSVPKVLGKKYAKRVDSIWGACKSDIQLDVFMVQHDMENMYMWVFKERPENALGKMQLRSYMNGHSRQGERLFPFSVDNGFVRSHKMQRKHYRGLSNPQCIHGIEVVPSPNLSSLDEDDRKRWMELTGRKLNLTIPPEASDYSTWRNLPNTEHDTHSHSKKLLNGSLLNLSTQPSNHNGVDVMDLSPLSNKRKKDFLSNGNNDDCFLPVNTLDRVPHLEVHQNEPPWLNEFTGVLRSVYGPVTAAKTIYEDNEGYLIVISLPFVDLQRVKVSWRNTLSHGIIKISCVSTSLMPYIKRQNRTFKLTDISPDHCPQGEFVREIPLSTRIPEDANIEAYYDGPGTVLEILVPKPRDGPEEHEVRVCLRPHHGVNGLMLN